MCSKSGVMDHEKSDSKNISTVQNNIFQNISNRKKLLIWYCLVIKTRFYNILMPIMTTQKMSVDRDRVVVWTRLQNVHHHLNHFKLSIINVLLKFLRFLFLQQHFGIAVVPSCMFESDGEI